jgi:hypothetical protein
VPPFNIIGKNHETLKQKFSPYPQAYLSIVVDSFPSFFMVLGPNAGVGTGFLTVLLEAQGDYVVKCIRKLQKEDYVTMMSKRQRMDDFSEYEGEYFKRTVIWTTVRVGTRLKEVWAIVSPAYGQAA